MSPYFLTVGLGVLTIIAMEWTMWQLFRRRLDGILLPCECDESHNRFFTLRTLRICAFIHTLFLLATLIGSALLAW